QSGPSSMSSIHLTSGDRRPTNWTSPISSATESIKSIPFVWTVLLGRRADFATSVNKVLPAPRPLRVRSDLHGPRRLWRGNEVARSLREPVCEGSGGGPRRQHKNVMSHCRLDLAEPHGGSVRTASDRRADGRSREPEPHSTADL